MNSGGPIRSKHHSMHEKVAKIVGAKVETAGTAGSQDTKPGSVGAQRVEKEAKQTKQE